MQSLLELASILVASRIHDFRSAHSLLCDSYKILAEGKLKLVILAKFYNKFESFSATAVTALWWPEGK
jgi:hypothetical protein